MADIQGLKEEDSCLCLVMEGAVDSLAGEWVGIPAAMVVDSLALWVDSPWAAAVGKSCCTVKGDTAVERDSPAAVVGEGIRQAAGEDNSHPWYIQCQGSSFL